MYLAKLDGRLSAAFYDCKAGEWRDEQERLLADIEDHCQANRTYIDAGVRLLKPAAASSATPVLDETHDLKLVAARLGHANEVMVLWRYGHLLPGADKGSCEAARRAGETGAVTRCTTNARRWLPGRG